MSLTCSAEETPLCKKGYYLYQNILLEKNINKKNKVNIIEQSSVDLNVFGIFGLVRAAEVFGLCSCNEDERFADLRGLQFQPSGYILVCSSATS